MSGSGSAKHVQDKTPKNWLAWLVNKLWLMLATLIILTALVFVLARVALPNTHWYQTTLIDWFENQFAVDIDLAEMEARWEANGPVIVVRDFTLHSNDQSFQQLSAGRVKIAVNFWKSLFRGGFYSDQIELEDTQLSAFLGRSLTIQLDAPDAIGAQTEAAINATSQLVLDTIFGQNDVMIKGAQLTLRTLDGNQFHYFLNQLRVENFGKVHQLHGEIRDQQLGKALLVAELFGEPGEKDYRASIYLQGQGIELASLPFFESQSTLKSGRLDWQLWAYWAEGFWYQAMGDVRTSAIEWQTSSADNKAQALQDFGFAWRWQAVNKDQGVGIIDNVYVQNSEQEAKLNQFAPINITYQRQGDHLHWRFGLKKWPVGQLVSLLGALSLDAPDLRQFLVQAKPELELKHLDLELARVGQQWQSPRLEGAFSGLHYEQFENWPRAQGLAGTFSVDNQQWRAQLSLKDSQLEFPVLFREPIPVSELEAELSGSFAEQEQSKLSIQKLRLRNADLGVVARAEVLFSEQAELSLYAEIHDANAAQKSRYLPAGIMSDNLVQYLDNSVRSGTLTLTKALLRGPLQAFPFHQDNKTQGVFAIHGKLEQSEFKYLPDWPVANDMNVDLLFVGNGMDLRASSAIAEGNRVNSARAIIEDFGAPGTPFDLYLDVQSSDNSGRRFLARSPLKSLADDLQLLDYHGTMQSQVELHLPLDDAEKIRLSGQVNLAGENLIKLGQLQLKELNGEVRFDQNGLLASTITGYLFSKKFSAKIAGKTNTAALSIDIDGELDRQLLSPYLGAFWAEKFSGSAPFDALIEVSPQYNKQATVLRLTSKMQGVSLDLPGELAKSASDNRDLFLTLTLNKPDNEGLIHFGPLRGRWQWSAAEKNFVLKASEFALNQRQDIPRDLRHGLNLKATFKALKLSDWWQLYVDARNFYQDNISGSAGGRDALPIGEINIDVAEIENPLLVLVNQSVSWRGLENGSWQFQIDSADFKGRLQIPEEGTWLADFERINVNMLGEENERDHQQQANAFWGDQVPAINLRCKVCLYNKKMLGSANLKIRTKQNLLDISGRFFEQKSHDIWFDGFWKQEQSGQKSGVNFYGRADNFSALLDRFDYPVAVKDSNAIMSARIIWPGAPWQIELATMQGDAIGELGKGYLSEVSDSGARIFSLFNIQSLTRKLQLDFKDVYKKGFFFDKMTGTITLKDGKFRTHDTFIDGSAAKVHLDGVIDVNENQINQYATVIPNLTSSLPVLAAWAVEPTTGLIVYILNKIMEPAIDVVTRIDYRIAGPLDKPQVEQIRRARKKVTVELPDSKDKNQNEAEQVEQNNDNQ